MLLEFFVVPAPADFENIHVLLQTTFFQLRRMTAFVSKTIVPRLISRKKYMGQKELFI